MEKIHRMLSPGGDPDFYVLYTVKTLIKSGSGMMFPANQTAVTHRYM